MIKEFQIAAVFLGAPFFAFLDSPWFSAHFFQGQDLNNVIMLIFFCWIFFLTRDKLRWLILFMVIVSFCFEVFGSVVFTLYQYHLANIPAYIPLGHAVVYATVYNLSRQRFIWHHHITIEKMLHQFAAMICLMSLIVLKDIAGFLCYLFFLKILKRRKKPLFFLLMFVVTYYLELLGTLSSAWSYYFVLANHPYYPPTSVTPCGIAGIYMLVDLTTNSVYLFLLNFKRVFVRKSQIAISDTF